MIRNVVFDVGSVLVDELGAETQKHLTAEEQAELQGIIFSKDFREVVLGNVTTEEYVRSLIEKFPRYKQEINAVLNLKDQSVSLPKRPWMIELLYRVRENGYKVFFLSDMIDATYTYMKSVLEDFDGGVYSYQEHVRKPDLKFFQVLIDRYNLDVAETIFFDDKLRNVEAARSLGMKAVVFTNINDVLEALPLK